MQFVRNDGGRAAAGFKGKTGDCVTRAIAIATGKPYREVYDALNQMGKSERIGVRKRGTSSSRDGVYKQTFRRYLKSLGWTWTPTMHIGSGCTVHLVAGELPMGRLIVSVSRHLTVVIDHVIHDTFDPQRTILITENGIQRITHRCVYGYFSSPDFTKEKQYGQSVLL